jgi:hypothetical protein
MGKSTDHESVKTVGTVSSENPLSGQDKGKDTKTDNLCDDAIPPFRLSSWLFRWKESSQPQFDQDGIATRRSVYEDLNLAKYYWPKADYENLHRFDPDARWTFREENASPPSLLLLRVVLTISFCRLSSER